MKTQILNRIDYITERFEKNFRTAGLNTFFDNREATEWWQEEDHDFYQYVDWIMAGPEVVDIYWLSDRETITSKGINYGVPRQFPKRWLFEDFEAELDIAFAKFVEAKTEKERLAQEKSILVKANNKKKKEELEIKRNGFIERIHKSNMPTVLKEATIKKLKSMKLDEIECGYLENLIREHS
jgi:hypothetical protein